MPSAINMSILNDMLYYQNEKSEKGMNVPRIYGFEDTVKPV